MSTRNTLPFRSRPRRALAALVAGVAAIATMTACGPVGGGDGGAGGGTGGGDVADDTVRIVLPEEPPTLEACQGSQSSTGRVSRQNIAEGLTFRDPTTSEVTPLLATEWEQGDGDSWTFTLRDGVTFQDGSPLTADAVVNSINRTMDPAMACDVAGQFFVGYDVKASKIDDSTVEVTTGAADPILPLRISFIGIVSEDTSATEKVREPIGTGPYMIDDWKAGTKLTLKRYDDYWGDAPDFATVEYVWRSETSTASAMVDTGEADIATQLTPADADADNAVTFQTNETAYMRFDTSAEPLDDMRIRQAINYAIDRQGILDSVFGGVGEIAAELVPEGVVGHNPDIEPFPFDVDKAKDLVAEAQADGVNVDAPIVIIGRNGIYPRASEAMEVVQAQLAEIGLNVKVEMMDVNAWLEFLVRPFADADGAVMLQGQHGNQAGDASFTMRGNYGTEGGQSTSGTPELDKLISEAEAASGDERQAAFEKALAYQNDEDLGGAVMVRVGGVIKDDDRVDYEPDSATYDEMRVADMHIAG